MAVGQAIRGTCNITQFAAKQGRNGPKAGNCFCKSNKPRQAHFCRIAIPENLAILLVPRFACPRIADREADAASVASPQAEKANRSPTNTPLKGRASRALLKAL